MRGGGSGGLVVERRVGLGAAAGPSFFDAPLGGLDSCPGERGCGGLPGWEGVSVGGVPMLVAVAAGLAESGGVVSLVFGRS